MENRGENDDNYEDLLGLFMKEMIKRKNDNETHFFTEKQCYFLLADLFGAGAETTVNTLRWFLLYMATHKEIQVIKNKLYLIIMACKLIFINLILLNT